MDSSAKSIINYHERTKHHPRRYARSAGYLDWANEPDPFRRYEGAGFTPLSLLREEPQESFDSLFDRKGVDCRPFTLQTLAAFLELSLGLSAWKSYQGNSWALRMNPSSGNLHPLEAYLLLPPLPPASDSAGVYHYNPLGHALEKRAEVGAQPWSGLKRHFGTEGFLVGLAGIHWRESWKYGERAFRYSHLDMGHAMAALSFSASLFGWRATYLNALSDHDGEILLGFDRTLWNKPEREEVGPLLFVYSANVNISSRDVPAESIRSFGNIDFAGEPNQLSRRYRDWGVIGEVSALTAKPRTPELTFPYGDQPCVVAGRPSPPGAQIIRKRRSALDFDGESPMDREDFLALLDRLVPRSGMAPFDVGTGQTAVHLLLFVHRVTGLEAGLYFLLRDTGDYENIRRACNARLLWRKVDGTPEMLPLYLLEPGDFRLRARHASCDQGIASDGAFGAAMIARFQPVLEKEPFRYRHLHWEAGMIGQVLYLGAEAAGLRGTGMGCFFDDVTHEILGLADREYQDLYHFGVGMPVDDTRIATLPAYHHLKR